MRRSPLTRNLVSVTALAALAFTLSAAPTVAAEARSETAQESCWYNLDDDTLQCFPSDEARTEAVEEQTDTTLITPSPYGFDNARAASPLAPAATYTPAIFYWSANYTDSTWIITTSISTMCTTHSWTLNSITGSWNNQIGSFKSFGTCKTRISDGTNQTGTQYGPVKNAPTLGSMNDKASSYFITG